MTPFRLGQLDHVVLRTPNLDAMIAFYGGVLGCSVERRLDDVGLVQLRAGAALIDLVPVDGKLGRRGGAAPGVEGRNLDHFCLTVEPFDEPALLGHLDAAGVEHSAVRRLYGATGFGPSIYISDPDGNTVELKGPGDLDTPQP